MTAESDQQEVGALAPSDAVISFDKIFSESGTVECMTIGRVAEWFKSKGPGQLRLPPIQRSLVWRNEQIINYWDSLLRGYPAGMMMVKRAGQPSGRNMENKTEPLTEPAFHLFDGQQRIFSLLLGLGEGALTESLRLWVDIGIAPTPEEDRWFVLRINSTGQPFGYQSEKPNEKPPVDKRHEKHLDWPKKDGKLVCPEEIFSGMANERPGTLGAAKCAVQLSHITSELRAGRRDEIRDELLSLSRGTVKSGDIDELLTRLENALKAEIIVKLVDSALLDESNYPRFFARLGQGGTRLSDEELTYSLIKNRYPHVHDHVAEIVRWYGRLASEVDLVLGALRVAQALAPWPGSKDWEIASRPNPDRVRTLSDKGREPTELYFQSMLPADVLAPKRMQTAIEHLLGGLLYDVTSNPRGLPSMLIARIPRGLLDVLLLFSFKRGEARAWDGQDRATLIAFVLHWLIFVGNDEKAAYDTFLEAKCKAACDTVPGVKREDWTFEQDSVAALLHHFEIKGFARHAPRADDWPDLMKEAAGRGHMLAKWDQRFSSRDAPHRASPGNALRVLSTHRELTMQALTWLQRHYVTQTFTNYNPTSTRDDDLPFDLDHAIPNELFGFWWQDKRIPYGLSDSEEANFRDLRGTVGNSLGNFRWLAASDNRGRGMKQIEDERTKESPETPFNDYIDRSSWNKLINADSTAKKWTKDDIETFQRLIDCRTLSLTKILMDESGVTDLIERSDRLPKPPPSPADL